MKPSQAQAVGVAWYTRENYQRAREIMEDPHTLPPTFDEWLQIAEKALQHAANQGAVPVKAYIDPETFPAWCRDRGLNVNANARTRYAAEIARHSYTEGHG